MAPKGIGDSKLGFTSIFRFHVKHWEGIVYCLLISCYLFLPLKTWISLVRLVSAIEVEESEGQIQEMTLEGADGIVEPLERWMALKQVPSLKLRPYIYIYTSFWSWFKTSWGFHGIFRRFSQLLPFAWSLLVFDENFPGLLSQHQVCCASNATAPLTWHCAGVAQG